MFKFHVIINFKWPNLFKLQFEIINLKYTFHVHINLFICFVCIILMKSHFYARHSMSNFSSDKFNSYVTIQSLEITYSYSNHYFSLSLFYKYNNDSSLKTQCKSFNKLYRCSRGSRLLSFRLKMCSIRDFVIVWTEL